MEWRTGFLVLVLIILLGAVLYIVMKTIPEEHNKKQRRVYRNRYGEVEYNTTNNYYYDVSGNKFKR